MLGKQVFNPFQRLGFNALRRRRNGGFRGGQVKQAIQRMLVDHLHLLHGVDETHKPLQRGVQALEKDGLNQVVKRAAAHGVAARLHIAGGGDKDHRTLIAFQQRVIDELNAFTVREIVVQQDQPRLMLTN